MNRNNNEPMLVQGGTVNVKNCSACGEDHDSLELVYVYPPVHIGNSEYSLCGVCPKTGEVLYAKVIYR